MSLLFLDVDHFKRYNDVHGHLKGDEVLLKIGEIIKDSLRNSEVAARYGGEEFAVLLPETPKENAGIVAEQIRKRIENDPFHGRETQTEGNLTISIGVAGYPQVLPDFRNRISGPPAKNFLNIFRYMSDIDP